jgi:diamine N-acetyltransferase
MVSYRKATLTDIETLRSLAREIWTASYSKMLSAAQLEYMLNWMYSRETIEKEMKEGVLWELIEYENKPIGYIAVTPEGEELKLNKIYILRTLQGKGIGQDALRHVMEYAKTNDYKKLCLTVNQRNYNAIKAYEKAGFKRTDFKVFDIGGGFVMDDYIYTYNL